METSFDPAVNPEMPAAPARPQFLTVLCILTWVSCGFLLIMSIWGVAFKPTAEERYQSIEQMREVNPEMADRMEEAFEAQENSNQTLGLAINLVAILLSALGAYMMWQLKKTGFYVYVGGEVLPYLGFLTGGSEAAMASLGGPAMAGIMLAVMVILDLIFIGMYAANLKHMRQ